MVCARRCAPIFPGLIKRQRSCHNAECEVCWLDGGRNSLGWIADGHNAGRQGAASKGRYQEIDFGPRSEDVRARQEVFQTKLEDASDVIEGAQACIEIRACGSRSFRQTQFPQVRQGIDQAREKLESEEQGSGEVVEVKA